MSLYKSLTSKKLAAPLFFLCLIFYSNLKAEIVYTDFEPDEVVTAPSSGGRNFDISFNADMLPEFTFQVNNFSEGYQSINISGSFWGNQVIVDGDTTSIGNFYPMALDAGYDINPANDIMWFNSWDANWGHSLPFAICGYGINGPGHWAENPQNKYLGVRFLIDDIVHYGWIAIEIPSKNTLIIKGFAYESEPNRAIIAGATGAASVENPQQIDMQIRVFPNPAADNIDVVFSDGFSGKVSIFNNIGEIVTAKDIENASVNSIQFNTSSLPNGIYLVSAVSGKNTIMRKLVIAK